MLEIANTLLALHQPDLCLDIHSKILNLPLTTAELIAYLGVAIPVAQAASNLELASKWSSQLSLLEQSSLRDPSSEN
jgi:hypothetical protein